MSKNLDYTLVKDGDYQNITVYLRPYFDQPYSADSSHPQWNRLLEGVLSDNPTVVDLFDIAKTIARMKISERVAVGNGRLYFDGDEVHDALASHIVRLIEEGSDQWVALVRFFENLQANPNDNSRQQLYRFLQKHGFTLTPEGCFLGYKSVYDDENGTYTSTRSGPAIVNGVEHKSGRVAQKIGDVVELPRTEIDDDPNTTCSHGLHVASWEYAKSFNGGTKLIVLVNPRDVVSVPTDSNDGKIRVCRYKIVDTTVIENTNAFSDSYYEGDEYDDDEYDDYCDRCRDSGCDCLLDEDGDYDEYDHERYSSNPYQDDLIETDYDPEGDKEIFVKNESSTKGQSNNAYDEKNVITLKISLN
jgi:hypothetical protein